MQMAVNKDLPQSDFTKQIFNILPYYPTRQSNPIIEYFVPLIWKDSVLFHVTLLLSAFELEKETSPKQQHRTRRLARRCLSLLQDRVNASGPDCVADETLSAIAGLAAVEVRISFLQRSDGIDEFESMRREIPELCKRT